MHPVAYIELISATACLAAIVFVIRGWKRPGFLRAVPILLLALLTLMMFYGLALFLEWSGLAERFHWHFIENLASVFIPFIWAFVFYAFVKNAVEKDLRASRRHFRNLVESTSDWIWEVDAEGRYTYVSPRVEVILGYTPEEVLGKTPFDLMRPEESQRIRVLFAETAGRQEPFEDIINVNLHKDGHEIVLETNGMPVFDHKGNLTGYRGVDRDITTRLKVERVQKRQQAEMDSVFRASPAGIGLIRNRKMVRGNERFFEITGYPENEQIGMDPRQFYQSDEDYLAVGEKYAEAMKSGFARIETHFVRKDQTVIDVVFYISPLDRSDATAGFAVIMQDITEFKAARQEAIAEKTRAQTYLDVVNAMILVLDPAGRVKLINKRGCELVGRSAEQIEGLDWFQSFVPASYRDISRNAFGRILTGDEKSVAYFENPIRIADGTEKLIAWHNASLRDESGKIIGVISSGDDITEVRAAQEAMRGSDERLRVALSAAKMGTWRWEVATDQDVRDASLNEILGLAAEETTQSKEDFFKFVHPDDQEMTRAECGRAMREKSSCQAEFRIVRPDGEIRWVLDKGKSFYDFNGQLQYMTGVVVDISERKQARDALREAEKRNELALQGGDLGTWDWDLTTGKVIYDERWASMLGYTTDELEQDFSAWERLVHPRDLLDTERILNRHLEGKTESYEAETRLKHKSGHWVWVLTKGQVIERDADGKALRACGTHMDITERRQFEQQLRDSEASLQKAQQIARLGFYDWDLQNNVVTASDGLKAFFGCELDEELTFDFVVSRIHPEDRERFVRADLESRTQGIPFSMDYRVLLPNGMIRWAQDQSEIAVDEQGNKVQMFGIILDITERKQAEEGLRQSEERNRAWLENSPVCTKILDLDFNLQYMSQAGIVGLNIEDVTEFYGKPYPFYFYPESFRNTMTKNLEKAKETGEIIDQEAPVVDTEGNELWFHSTIVPVRDDRGRIDYIIVVSADITERKDAEQQREELLRKLQFTQFAFDNAGEAAHWVDIDERFIYVNDMDCLELGYTREELMQMKVCDIDPFYPREDWEKHWGEMREQGVKRFEGRHVRKDGTIFPVEVTSKFVTYEGKEYICSFERDITELKIAEQKREVLAKQLLNRNDELQSIVFAAAHDLRTPLVNITGFSGELEKSLAKLTETLDGVSMDTDVSEKIDFLLKTDVPESLRFIKFGNQQMDMLLGGLMRLSRVGTASVKESALDMYHLFDSVVQGFQYQINTLDIDLSIQEDIPDCIGDYSLMSQVFINLLDNAIKYRHPDRKTVIKMSGSMQDEIAEYTISDNGIGIEPEQQEKVFDLFHQLHNKPDAKGQGLGLTIVRRIMDRQQGSVEIDSTPEEGTTIFVRLPRA